MVWLCDVRCWRDIVVLATIVHTLTRITAFHCMFDLVKPRRVIHTDVSYVSVDDTCLDRCRRGTSDRLVLLEDLFQPIRIHAFFSSSRESGINAAEKTRLRDVIDRLVLTASQIFSGKYFYIMCEVFNM